MTLLTSKLHPARIVHSEVIQPASKLGSDHITVLSVKSTENAQNMNEDLQKDVISWSPTDNVLLYINLAGV